MHHQNNTVDILCIAGNDFSNSISELKEHLNFNLSFLGQYLYLLNIAYCFYTQMVNIQ